MELLFVVFEALVVTGWQIWMKMGTVTSQSRSGTITLPSSWAPQSMLMEMERCRFYIVNMYDMFVCVSGITRGMDGCYWCWAHES